jgi:single-stranded-DNA-specific exonuclease
LMKTWVEPETIQVPDDLLAATGGGRFLAEVLLGRGLGDPDIIPAFLDPDHYHETPPDELPNIAMAVERLFTAVKGSQPILIWGDYDVDGQTATTLLYTYLKNAGARVSYHLPVRAKESHGIQPAALMRHLKADTRLLITCDTGISEIEGIKAAREADKDVIITDHHNLPEALPEATAILNPKLLPAGHRLGELSGVGVAYKLIQALDNALTGGTTPPAHDLVALGTIADLALLVDDNRYLVQRGLPLLAETSRVGLRAVYQTAELQSDALNEETIAFILAPRLNAVGRLADANRMVELLSTDDVFKAEIIASEIEGLNARRRLLSNQVHAAAMELVEQNRALLDQPCLVLSHPAWPGGILGIVASSLVEIYNRPVILFSSPPGSPARGSARSIPGIDITAAIEAHRDLLLTYGGHPMAAGLSLLPEKLPEFQAAITATVSQLTGGAAFKETLILDAVLPVTQLPGDMETILKRLSPFGPGNPQLTLLARSLTVQSSRSFGRNHDHLRITLADSEGKTAEVIWWRSNGQKPPEGSFDLAYSLKPASYKGHKELQITWVDARAPVEAVAVIGKNQAVTVYDHRLDDDPSGTLKSLVTSKPLLIWREGSHIASQIGANRLELTRAESLAIWTIPSSFASLQVALKTVKAREVHLFALEPEGTRLDGFQTRLAGLVKYAIANKGGHASLDELAAAMAHDPATLMAGLEWLRAHGDITYEDNGRKLIFKTGGARDETALEPALDRLLDLLAETAAFRVYYRHTPKHFLLD